MNHKLRFEKWAETIVDKVKSGLSSSSLNLGISLKISDDLEVTMRAPNENEELLFKNWYGMFISQKISGNVVVRVLPKEIFSNNKNFTYFVFLIRRYGGVDLGDVDEIKEKDYYLSKHKLLTDIWCGVSRINVADVFKIIAIGGEKEIVEAVEVAARLAKSLSRHIVPVIAINTGEIIDYAQIGYEELLFIELLRHFLVRERWQNVS
jgi:hypothetical protein